MSGALRKIAGQSRIESEVARTRGLIEERQFAAALSLGETLLAEVPENRLKALGRQQEAIQAYRSAAAVRPNYGDAYWSLANLKTYQFADDEIARMRAEEAADATVAVDRYHLCFALGKALEDRGEFTESYRYYERGNALKKLESRYRPEPVERNTRLQKTVCTAEFIKEGIDQWRNYEAFLAPLRSALGPLADDAS